MVFLKLKFSEKDTWPKNEKKIEKYRQNLILYPKEAYLSTFQRTATVIPNI